MATSEAKNTRWYFGEDFIKSLGAGKQRHVLFVCLFVLVGGGVELEGREGPTFGRDTAYGGPRSQ